MDESVYKMNDIESVRIEKYMWIIFLRSISVNVLGELLWWWYMVRKDSLFG